MALQISNPKVEKEFRFAVVMYGGVSLAIYINGVAQELYKMVRATATQKDGSYVVENPQGTEAVYRDLGRHLEARFVVDVLSGTSAGGINAVYLAKALANNQSMAELESMWIEEGDIKSLINDRLSVKKVDAIKRTRPLRSLLNSDRIYYKLLYALECMDKSAPRSERYASPFVDELDLYVTASDLRGVWRPIMLTDRETSEKKFRAVFRFYYSALGDEETWVRPFRRANNPFLAFVARATCALPVAFRPARLSDLFDLRGRSYTEKRNYGSLTSRWSNFLRDYSFEADHFALRSFGDGGALDNKPFSYITESLLRRQSNVPIDRRLFYIEPAPEHPESDSQRMPVELDAIENLLAQGLGLPRYETIREDLLQVKARNDLIQRTGAIIRRIERSGGNIGDWEGAKKDWQSLYLDEMLAEKGLFGPGYAAYHQLRVSVVLDDFASAVARNLGIPEDGSSFLTLRQIFEGWRASRYSSNSSDGRRSENELLYRLDMNWRLRRLQFLLRIVDGIRQGIGDFRTDLEPAEQTYARDLVKNSFAKEQLDEFRERWSLPDQGAEDRYLGALTRVKDNLKEAYSALRTRGRQLRQRNLAWKTLDSKEIRKDPELIEYRQALQPLRQLREQVTEIANDERQLEEIWAAIDRLSLTLAPRPDGEATSSTGYLHQTFRDASRLSQKALAAVGPSEAGALSPEENVRACLQFYYANFEYYDKLTFPITYATPVGESDVVDVYRISPEDASTLYREREGKRKLAGTILQNFGAFFKDEWRKNDILWGQLDAAERIITTVLPDEEKGTEQHAEFLIRAWLATLRDKQNLLTLANREKLQERFRNLEQNGMQDAWKRFAGSQEFTSEELKELHTQLQQYFDSDYTLDLKFPSLAKWILIGRSLFVLADLLMCVVTRRYAARWQRGLKPAWMTALLLIFASAIAGSITGALSGYAVGAFWIGILLLMLTAGVYQMIGYYGSADGESKGRGDTPPDMETQLAQQALSSPTDR